MNTVTDIHSWYSWQSWQVGSDEMPTGQVSSWPPANKRTPSRSQTTNVPVVSIYSAVFAVFTNVFFALYSTVCRDCTASYMLYPVLPSIPHTRGSVTRSPSVARI